MHDSALSAPLLNIEWGDFDFSDRGTGHVRLSYGDCYPQIAHPYLHRVKVGGYGRQNGCRNKSGQLDQYNRGNDHRSRNGLAHLQKVKSCGKILGISY